MKIQITPFSTGTSEENWHLIIDNEIRALGYLRKISDAVIVPHVEITVRHGANLNTIQVSNLAKGLESFLQHLEAELDKYTDSLHK